MSEADDLRSEGVPPRIEVQDFVDDEEVRPPLPPRPSLHNPPHNIMHGTETGSKLRKPSRPQLQASATTALSLTDIHTQSYQDGSRETFAAQAEPSTSGRFLRGFGNIRHLQGHSTSEADSASVKSYAPTLETGGDVESLLGEVLGASPGMPAWGSSGTHDEGPDLFEALEYEDEGGLSHFDKEFDELEELSVDAGDEGEH